MNKLRVILLPLLLLSLTNLPTGQVKITQPTHEQIDTRQLDKRAKILADYFRKYDSPLENQAQDFIDAADKYGVDWKLVPAISGVESTFGKQSYGFNAWGWGIYGTQALGFRSWKDGIFIVTGGLRESYINRGLDEPYEMNRVYAASPHWGGKVKYFMNDLEGFANRYQGGAKSANHLAKTAAASARLTYKGI